MTVVRVSEAVWFDPVWISSPSRLSSSAADRWRRQDCAGSGVCDGSEGGAPPQRTGWRLKERQSCHWGLEPAPPGGRIHSAGPPHFLLPPREGPVGLHAAQRPVQQPGLQASPCPGSTLPPKCDFGLDGPAGGKAGRGCEDTVGAQQGELPGAGAAGSKRVQRREHTVSNGDPGIC